MHRIDFEYEHKIIEYVGEKDDREPFAVRYFDAEMREVAYRIYGSDEIQRFDPPRIWSAEALARLNS